MRDRPRVRVSTVVALVAAVGAITVLVAVIGMQRGVIGDRGMALWLYGSLLSLLAGMSAVPLAIGGTDVVPAWQWIAEAIAGGAAFLIAVIAGFAVLF
jgi:hypothetical protein